MLREFLLGFIKIHILHHAVQDAVYGSALIEELKRHGYDIGPGTIYPVLHGMERAGYLARDDRLVDGKIRKYYTATPAGAMLLEEVRPKVAELVSEVVVGNGPAHIAPSDNQP